MLEKYGVNCDDCGKYYHLSGRCFRDKIEEIKEAGWKIRKFLGLWCHYCPDCESPQPVKQLEKETRWYDQF